MRNFGRLKQLAFATCAAFALVLAIHAPSEAAGGGHGGGFSGGHSGGFSGAHAEGHGGFESHRGFDGHRFDGHHFDGRVDGRFRHGFVGPVYPDYGYGYGYAPDYGYSGNYPAYSADTPSYYWYCPSYGAYYPSVDSCPDAWQPVPTS